ncbi:MAG: hypothetical protein ACRCXD_03405 [Luteolibacter sp.]
MTQAAMLTRVRASNKSAKQVTLEKAQVALKDLVIDRFRQFGIFYAAEIGFTLRGTNEPISENHLVSMLRRELKESQSNYQGRILDDAIRNIMRGIRQYMDTRLRAAAENPDSLDPGVVWVDDDGNPLVEQTSLNGTLENAST